jgi:glycerate 2-kinase
VLPDTLLRASRLRRSSREFHDDNDACQFFQRLGDLVILGPTLANVNDFRAILVQ